MVQLMGAVEPLVFWPSPPSLRVAFTLAVVHTCASITGLVPSKAPGSDLGLQTCKGMATFGHVLPRGRAPQEGV